jgi:predicted N-formylglutamate amidohydrolase
MEGAMGDARLSAVVVENPDGAGPLVVVCDHASNRIPEEYKSLGLTQDVLKTHIAWDPGALNVARHLSARLDAPLLWPDISRRVIDCNRAPVRAREPASGHDRSSQR